MPVFNTRYLTEEEVWAMLDQVIEERDEVQRLLASPDICQDPVKMPDLARRLLELNQICHVVEELRSYLKDKQELETLINEDRLVDGAEEFQLLYEECAVECSSKSQFIYRKRKKIDRQESQQNPLFHTLYLGFYLIILFQLQNKKSDSNQGTPRRKLPQPP